MSKKRLTVVCSNCNQSRRHSAKGLCNACYLAKRRQRQRDAAPAKCSDCKQLTALHIGSRCQYCYYVRAKVRREAAHPQHERARQLKILFGITLEQYRALLSQQGGHCACCPATHSSLRGGRPRALAVDHDHSTGKIRGLLCSKCNFAAGQLDDDPARAYALGDYLRASTTPYSIAKLDDKNTA